MKAASISDLHPRDHTVLFLITGQGWLDSPQPRRKMASGSLCILPKGCAFRYTLKPQSEVLWFKLPVSSSWSQWLPTSALVTPALFANELKLLCEAFLQDDLQTEDLTLWEGYVRLITLILRRQFVRLGIQIDFERLRRLEDLWDKVSERPAEEWSIESLARRSNYSRSHFHAMVQNVYESGAMEIVANLRMKQAMGLIHDQHMKIAMVAESVGYNSPFSFSRAFKRIIGVTPEVYRQKVSVQ